jgi:hypothetical protein
MPRPRAPRPTFRISLRISERAELGLSRLVELSHGTESRAAIATRLIESAIIDANWPLRSGRLELFQRPNGIEARALLDHPSDADILISWFQAFDFGAARRKSRKQREP